MKNENYFIDFLRFVFSLIILLYHSWLFSYAYGYGLFNCGMLAVDFFFIVTGYLMINSMYKREKNTNIFKDNLSFIFGKIKGLFPALLLAFIIGILLVCNFDIRVIYAFIKGNIDNLLAEIGFLSIFGYPLLINNTWWYISAMLIIMFIVYPISKKYKEKYTFYIAPIIILITIGLIKALNINIHDSNLRVFYLTAGFYRGIVYLLLGNICFEVTKALNHKKINNKKRMILSFIEIVSYIVLIANMHFNFLGTLLHSIMMFSAITLSFSELTWTSRLFKSRKWKELGKYGFYIFLVQVSVRTFLHNNYAFSYKKMLVLYVGLSCLIALIIYVMVEIIYKKIIYTIIRKGKEK